MVPRPSRGSLPRAAAAAGLWPQPPPPLRGLSRRPGGAAGGGRAARMLAAGSDMAAPSAALRRRRAAAGGGAPEAPERAVAEPADSGAGLPLLPPPSGTFWLTRIVLLRSIALLYCESPGAAPRLFLSPGSGWGTRPGPARRSPGLLGAAVLGLPRPSRPSPLQSLRWGRRDLCHGEGGRAARAPTVPARGVHAAAEVPPWWERRRPVTVVDTRW